MKYILTLVLTIFLTGNFTPDMQKIADKYSPYFSKDIVVSVVDRAGYSMGAKNCGLEENDNVVGCTYWPNNVPSLVEVENGRHFEYGLVHEVTHYQTGMMDESFVNRLTRSIIGWVNNIK